MWKTEDSPLKNNDVLKFLIYKQNLVTYHQDFFLRFWDETLTVCKYQLNIPHLHQNTLKIVDDEIWGAHQGIIYIYNLITKNKLPTFKLHDHEAIISSITAHEEIVASCSLDGKIRIWDKKKKICTKVINTKMKLSKICFWKNDLVVGGFGPIWNLDVNGNVKWKKQNAHQINTTSLIPYGDYLFSAAADKSFKIWSSDGQLLKNMGFINQVSVFICFGQLIIIEDLKLIPEIHEISYFHHLCEWKEKILICTNLGVHFLVRTNTGTFLFKVSLIIGEPLHPFHVDDIMPPEMVDIKEPFEAEWLSNISDAKVRTVGIAKALQLDPSKHSTIYQKLSSEVDTNFDIERIELIVNENQERMFHSSIQKVEIRQNFPDFQPNLDSETSPEERKAVLDKLAKLASNVSHNRKAKILKAFHGTSIESAEKILNLGFASLGKIDSGWYGKGIYLSSNATYATRYSSSDVYCLLVCYVIAANPYPVIHDDAPNIHQLSFYGKGNYKNYSCHYVPVVAYGNEQTTKEFRPPEKGKTAKYDEIVIFQEEHILPKYIIFLRRKTPLVVQPDTWSVEGVCMFLKSLELSKDYSEILQKEHIDGKVLISMSQEDFKSIGISVFGDWKKISNAIKNLNETNEIERQIVD